MPRGESAASVARLALAVLPSMAMVVGDLVLVAAGSLAVLLIEERA